MDDESTLNVLMRETHVEEGWDTSWELSAMALGDMDWWPSAIGIMAWLEAYKI